MTEYETWVISLDEVKGEIVGTITIPEDIRIQDVIAPYVRRYQGRQVWAYSIVYGEIVQMRVDKEFTGTREWDCCEMYEVCNKYQLFTRGTNEQYSRMFDMVADNSTFEEIAKVIWLCSDKSFTEVVDILHEEFSQR